MEQRQNVTDISKEEFRRRVLDVFVACMKYELTGVRFSEEQIGYTDESVKEMLLRLSLEHDVAAFVGNALLEHELLDKESKLGRAFLGILYKTVIKYEKMEALASRVSLALEENKIFHIRLKGETISRFYKHPEFRKSCDIDILVNQDEHKKACRLLEQMGFERGRAGSHDVAYSDSEGNKIELHYRLIEDSFSFFDISVTADKTKLVEGREYTCEMTSDIKYAYLITHTAKHFKLGGCGLRSIADIFVLSRLDEGELAEARKMLSELGVAKFEEAVMKLADAWFCGGESDGMTDELAYFILRGGVFGTKEQMVAVRRGNDKKLKYFMKRIFLPYVELKQMYPRLVGKKYLTPAYEVHRWFSALFNRKRYRAIKEEIKMQKSDSATRLCEYLKI